jgi:hypothetical protein
MIVKNHFSFLLFYFDSETFLEIILIFNYMLARFARSVDCFCRSLFDLFLLAIVLSVHLRLRDTDCSFDIFNLFLIMYVHSQSTTKKE